MWNAREIYGNKNLKKIEDETLLGYFFRAQ